LIANKIDKNIKEVDELSKDINKLEKALKDATDEYKKKAEIILSDKKLKKGKLLSETNALRQQRTTTKKNSNYVESEILQESHIILTTLSMSGTDLLDKLEFNYSHLIIDEAGQCTEISSLIPFGQNVDKVILVGDQNQLPATVFSDNGEITKFNRSLYERFLDNQIPCFTLKIQYRMHASIRAFPSSQFYNDEIIDGKTNDDESITLNGTIPRLMFYNLEYTKSSSGKTFNVNHIGAKSKTNELEAEFIAKIFIQAVTLKGDGNFYKGLQVAQGQIGIITPYKRQSYLIKDKISKQIKSLQNTKSKNTKMYAFEQPDSDEVINIDKIVQISTVDSFQGREKDTIIIS
jgi:senataxin